MLLCELDQSSTNFFLKDQIISVSGFAGKEAKLRPLQRYLYNHFKCNLLKLSLVWGPLTDGQLTGCGPGGCNLSAPESDIKKKARREIGVKKRSVG